MPTTFISALKHRFQPYAFSSLLVLSILLGGLIGGCYPESTPYLKPIGQFFLNLMLMAVVPLIFFSVTSSLTKLKKQQSLSSQLGRMLTVFLGLGMLASGWMLMMVYCFPIKTEITLPTELSVQNSNLNILHDWPSYLTVSHFYELFSTEHSLALIIFSLILGSACRTLDNDNSIKHFFIQGERVCIELFNHIMWLAPLGFMCYFAAMTAELGQHLIHQYLSVVLLYLVGVVLYMIIIFSSLMLWMGGLTLVKNFWLSLGLPATTAIATCSSAACIPANFQALKQLQVADTIAEPLVPLGTLLHKQGSIMGGVLKIAFLLTLFHLNFNTGSALLTAFGVSLLVGMVMGAIPSGGMLGELLILHLYGFPNSALYLIATISLLIDAPATLLNVCGNTLAGVIVDRWSKLISSS